jgi:hypothetical protein
VETEEMIFPFAAFVSGFAETIVIGPKIGWTGFYIRRNLRSMNPDRPQILRYNLG